MKKNLFLVLLFSFSLNLVAQFDYDYIGRDEFSIIETVTYSKSISPLKASGIKSGKNAEKLFGKNYKNVRHYSEIREEYYKVMTYDSGLELKIPENEMLDLKFHIMSDKYMILLNNDLIIKVGMNSDELKSIFPKSFLKRTKIENTNRTGMIVYFSRLIGDRFIIEDSWITFIFGENNVLEEIYTWEPS